MTDPVAAPRVSVVMPANRNENYIKAAVDSILGQTFRDFELIALDDRISSQTSAILTEYGSADPRVRIVTMPADGYLPKLNRGLQLARGDYVARMDTDDISAPTRFEKQVAFLDAHPDVAVVGTAITLIDEHGLPLRDADYPLLPEEIAQALQSDCVLAHPSIMMRREAAAALGGYRAAFRPVDDYDLWLRISERHAIANLPDRLLQYRQHTAKVSFDFAAELILATRVAQLAAHSRRAGRSDPIEGLQQLVPHDLGRFGLTRKEVSSIVLDLAEQVSAAELRVGTLKSLAWTADYLAEVDFSLVDPGRIVRIMLWMAIRNAQCGRTISALKWGARAATCRPNAPVIAAKIAVGEVLSRAAPYVARLRNLRSSNSFQ